MRPAIAFIMVAAIGVLAACHGYQPFTPVAQTPQASAMADMQLRSLLPPGIDPRASGVCSAPTYKPAAGPFILFIANGNVKRGKFKSGASPLTLWVAFRIKKATKPTPPPTTSPSGSPSTPPSPTPPPQDKPVYFYLGQYTLAKSKQTGCAFVFATQSGKPFTGSKYGALAFGEPLIAFPKYYKEKVVAHGPVTVTISKLSATGGKGSATLKLGNGSTFDTATVNLTYRISEP
ncbi:MAG TPA: hypothetical protein VFE36_17050 [Candidatus Baltobacteraceae bacterium]|jgi:hypothetical protein|nr:hypothetical protein [Candidatus Baltobacteraceae bacterium]